MGEREVLLTVEQVAEDRLHMSRSQVYGLVKRGELPSVRIGRALRIVGSDVDRYIARVLNEQRHR